MMQIAPPPLPPRVALEDMDDFQPLQVRLWLVWVTILTVLATAWVCSYGPIPAIVAIVTAKHVLVAILVMGLQVNKTRQAE
jgi:hypothetical protein